MSDKLQMNSLDVMAGACVDAVEAMDEDPHWRSAYATLVDPYSVLQLIALVRQMQEPKPERISEEELRVLGNLVRDMTGYLKLATGDKPDPVRDDLLLNARQLLGVVGI